ncbi:hypothetical protein G6O69_26160 [Pseudenhygromyxa sp. WMMC2535]|uniref:hypothetical protein n=1 Tax=Pseudenhygromyxa sp. WMMC2535 TaxID=2712867 RepID=UPI001553CE94|nr:hypothetical protein [Pseudenhygromyxa sp. WMMC2535]NVB41349.1 hypothetical protein [Pseudenhygromyxa sp. WMMC2535]
MTPSSVSSPAAAAPPGAWATASAPPRPRAPLDRAQRVDARSLVGGLLGFLALGAAAALGEPLLEGTSLRLVPSVLMVELSAMALTTPALIALHQFLDLEAPPEALAAACGRALVHGGRVAGGLTPLVLFYAATTSLGVFAMLVSLAAVGVFTTVTACVSLNRVELRATPPAQPGREAMVAPRFTLLVLAWVALSWVIALRVGVDVGTWVTSY